MAISAVELRAIITADDSLYQQRMAAVLATSQRAQTEMARSVSVIDQLGPSLLKAGAAMTALTAPFDFFIKAGTDINQKLVEIRNNTILSNQESEQMRATILKLASESPAKIEDIGQAYFRLANFGLKGTDATVALEAALKSAVGTGAQVEKTAEALGVALHDFHLQASQSATVMGVLHNAAAAGNLTLEQLVSTTGKLFNVAGSLGLKLEDTVGTFAALTKSGLPAAQASTALSTALTKIINPTKQSAAELAELSRITGVDLTKDFSLAGIQAKGLQGIVGDLAEATRGHEDAILRVMAAQRGGLAFLGLTKRESEDLIPILANLAKVEGGELTPIQDGFNRAMDQTGNQLSTLKNKIEVFAASVTEHLGANLAPLFTQVGQAIDDIAAGWSRLEGPQQQAILAFGGVAAAVGPVMIALGAIVTFLGGELAAALVAASLALATFGAAYAGDWNSIRTSVNEALTEISKYYSDNKVAIDDLAKVSAEALKGIVGVWLEAAKSIADIVTAITLSLRLLQGDFKGAWEEITRIGAAEQEKSKKSAEGWMGDMFKLILGDTSGFPRITAGIQAAWQGLERILVAGWESLKTQTANAWNFIRDAIIHPIQEAIDYLKNKVNDFKWAFEQITEAAKRGLQVHSPPIAAIWIGEIGKYAGVSAEATKASAPVFARGMSDISSAATAHLPKVAGAFVGMASQVIKILEELHVKVPKVFQDIFGSISGAGRSAGAAAKKTGTELGDQLVAGLSAALEGVKGVASAAKQGGVFGAIEGALGGAMAGAKIGSLFGPGPGTAIGAAIGGALGLLGGLFGKSALQKAQEAAALQQARDAVRVSQENVLQMVEKTKQSWIETLDKSRALLESISFYTKVPKLAFNQFFADVGKLFAQLGPLAAKFKSAATAEVKAAAENLGAMVTLVAALPQALEGIAKFLGVPDVSFKIFFDATLIFFNKLDELFSNIPKQAAKATSKWSKWLKDAVDLIIPLTDGLTGLLTIKEVPSDAQFKILTDSIQLIVQHVTDLGGIFDKSLLKQMAFFSDKAQAALGLWKDAIDAIKATVDVPTITGAQADTVVSGIRLFLERMIAGLSDLATDQLSRVAGIAGSITPIATAIKAWADTATAIRGYTAIAAETWNLIVQDFLKGISLLLILLDQAIQFEGIAIKLEDHLKAGAGHLTAGIAAMRDGLLGTASVLNQAFGQIQGGPSTPGGSMGTLSTGSSTSSATSTTVNLTLHSDNPEVLARLTQMLQEMADLFGAGTGLSSALSQQS